MLYYKNIRVLWISLFFICASGCYTANWETSITKEGYSTCESDYEYITGFVRGDRTDADDISSLKGAECCDRTSPWSGGYWESQTILTDWWSLLNRNNRWATCPNGYFLAGLYRSVEKSWWSKKPGFLKNIEEGRCTKPGAHPYRYGQCYEEDIDSCFDQKGTCKCKAGYFVTGIYKGPCDQLHCLDKLRCCQMASNPDPLDSMEAVKIRVMDTTLQNAALLAYYMGYSWCSGCRSETVGEDFRRYQDTWYADNSRRCEGYRSDERLNIVYGHWRFEIIKMRYGRPKVNNLQPESIDMGTIFNNDSTPVKKAIQRTETTVRSVSHVTTSSWKNSKELGLQFSYTPPVPGLQASQDYKFSYETSTTTTDTTSKSQGNTFSIVSEKTLAPYTAATWKITMSKVRTTIPYVATVAIAFSTEFQGFLRYGGGYDGDSTNFHHEYRGDKDSPTFKYRFGDKATPFYKDLKKQYTQHSLPWMWTAMENRYPYVKQLIENLSNIKRYTFSLKGYFQDTIGKHADLHWDKVVSTKKTSTTKP